MLYLIDASVYIFRAFFSLPDSIRDKEGQSANVIYGFADFLIRFRKDSGANKGALCFDESLTTSFRNEIDPGYKANRPEAPEDLKRQIKACKDIGEMMGFPVYASPRYEADDLIGSLARQYRQWKSGSICIVSTDKDLLQVLEPGDEFWNFGKDERFETAAVQERMGVAASQVADLLALTGDAVDNIPGLPGIGGATAARLLQYYGSVDALLANLDSLDKNSEIRGAPRFKAIIEQNLDVLERSRQLTAIVTDLQVEQKSSNLDLKPPDIAKLKEYFETLGVGARLMSRLSTDAVPAAARPQETGAKDKKTRAKQAGKKSRDNSGEAIPGKTGKNAEGRSKSGRRMKMKKSDSQDGFVDYVEDLFSGLGQISARKMFGGYGIYQRQRMFGLIAYDRLYMKVDDALIPEFQKEGSEPFVYESPGRKPVQMSYWSLPEDALESPALAQQWALKSLEAAVRSATKTKARKSQPVVGKKASKKDGAVAGKKASKKGGAVPGKKAAKKGGAVAGKKAAKKGGAVASKKTAKKGS
ncbi:MAG: TfoX/Sxy family protein, partial [Leptospiraceae bacterium]|nr:TfoX/Sxy family protein [Leptospiraceae bacterium]